MRGRGIMRGRPMWLCPFKANASGQLLLGTEPKREMGKTWLIKTASAQGSRLLWRADLSTVKHLLILKPVQRDCLNPCSRALKAKQVQWLSMRPCCCSWGLQGLGESRTPQPRQQALAFHEHEQDALNIHKWASLYASAQILLWQQVLKLMWEEEVDKLLFKITSSSYFQKLREVLEEGIPDK